MINKILKQLKKMKNMSRIELEDVEMYLELEVNNGEINKRKLLKKAINFVRN